jgi:hypothetical protein
MMGLRIIYKGATNKYGIYDCDYSEQPIVEYDDRNQAMIEMYVLQKRLEFHREQEQTTRNVDGHIRATI